MIKKIRVFGIETGRIYAEGTEPEIHQWLLNRYPTFRSSGNERLREKARCPIYPEPLAKSRVAF